MGEVEVVQVASWRRYGWLRHGFSTRNGGTSTVYGRAGELNLGYTREDDPAQVAGNRQTWAQAVAGRAECALLAVRQVHGVEMKVVAAGESGLMDADGRGVYEADGLLTQATGVMLGIQVADCVPLLLVDTRQRVVAALHAGWRGAAAGMAERGVARMRQEFGSRAQDLEAAVGPSIGACCYAVGEEVRSAFEDRYSYADQPFAARGGQVFLDLWEANRRQLQEAGVPADGVHVVGECTGCTRQQGERKYFSHRAEGGVAGRGMGTIGVVEE